MLSKGLIERITGMVFLLAVELKNHQGVSKAKNWVHLFNVCLYKSKEIQYIATARYRFSSSTWLVCFRVFLLAYQPECECQANIADFKYKVEL